MKRPSLTILVSTQLLAGAAGWWPALACGQQHAQSVLAGGGGEAEYRLPSPVLVEPPPLPPVGALTIPEATCPVGNPAPVCPSGPLGRWYHCRAKPALQESHWGYPEQFCVRPFGSYMRGAVVAQVQNGISAQLVLYHSDFVTAEGLPGVELNAKGRLRLEKLSELMPMSLCPLVIEVNEQDPTLNAARRAHVAALLQQAFAEFPDERVVVGRPVARGLAAPEAVFIHNNLRTQVETMGSLESYSGGRLTPFSYAPGGQLGGSGGSTSGP